MEGTSTKSSKRERIAAVLLGVGAAAAVGSVAWYAASATVPGSRTGALAGLGGPRLGLEDSPDGGEGVELVPRAPSLGGLKTPVDATAAAPSPWGAVHGPEAPRLLVGASDSAEDDVAISEAARDPGAPPKELAARRATGPKKTNRDGLIASSETPRGVRTKAATSSPEVAQVGSAVRVTTSAHTAEFHASGFEFTPHDRRGVRAPASRFAYRLEGVQRGENVLWAGGDCAPVASGNQVRYERAPGLVEHYLALDQGVEQLFSLPQVPGGSGDLVFRAVVETDLEGRQDPRGGLHFQAAPGLPGVVFGRAVVYDGLGRSTPAALTLAGAKLELRVPGDWPDLQSLAAPIPDLSRAAGRPEGPDHPEGRGNRTNAMRF